MANNFFYTAILKNLFLLLIFISAESAAQAEREEIIITLKYAGVVNVDMTAYYALSNTIDTVFVSFMKLCEELDLNYSFDPKTKKISGFLITPDNTYEIDFHSLTMTKKGIQTRFDSTKVVKSEFDYFIEKETLEKVLGFQLIFDFANLTLTIITPVVLPVYLNVQREKNFNLFKGRDLEAGPPLLYDRERSMIDFGFLDYYLSALLRKDGSPFYTYQLGAGGELFGGDAFFSFRGDHANGKTNLYETTYRWRYVLQDNNYLTQVLLGNLFYDGLSPLNLRGIQVTNEPIEPRKNYATYVVTDKTEPNYTIELYINDRLLDITKSDALGNFTFRLPVTYGTTLVKMKFYGPSGEYFVIDRLYQTPYFLLPEGEINYNVSLGEVSNTDRLALSTTVGWGITGWLTGKAGIEYFDSFTNNSPVVYTNLTSRIASPYLLSLTTAPNAFHRLNASAMYPSLLSIGAGYTSYEENTFYNPTNLIDELTANFFIPLNLLDYNISFQGNARLNNGKQSDRYEYSLGTTLVLGSFSPSISYRINTIKNSSATFSSSTIDLGFLLSISKLPSFLNFLTGNLVSGRFSYNNENKKLDNYSVTFSTSILKNSRLQISHSGTVASKFTNTQLQLIVYFPFTQYSTTTNKEISSHTIVGSIGYDSNYEKVNFYNRQQIGRASASFRMFIDDGDGHYSDDEELLNNINLTLGNTYLRRENDDVLRAAELNPYTSYEVNIIESSIKNPILVPYTTNFIFRTDPNTYKLIDVPFYVASEISGKVEKENNGVRTEVAGLKILITNLKDSTTVTTNTYSDGTFYYFGLKPGDYKVAVDNSVVKKFNLISTPEEIAVEIKPSKDGEFLENVNFTLIPSN